MTNISLYMPMGQETMGDLWAPEFLSEIIYLIQSSWQMNDCQYMYNVKKWLIVV